MANHNIPDAGRYQEDARDWTLDGSDDPQIREKLKANAPKSDYQYEWNQSRDPKTRSFCTAFAPMCSILSYKEKDRGAQQWSDFFDRATREYGYQPGVGNYMSTGVKAAVNYWNVNHPDDPLVYYNVGWNTPDFWYAVELGYRLTIGGKYNAYYQADRREDNIINRLAFWKKRPQTFGHILTTVIKDTISRDLKPIDNYKGRMDNIYEIPNDLVDDVARGSDDVGMYPSAYVITSAKVMDETEGLPFEIRKDLETLMQARSRMWKKINEDRKLLQEDKDKLKSQLHKENNRYREEYSLK